MLAAFWLASCGALTEPASDGAAPPLQTSALPPAPGATPTAPAHAIPPPPPPKPAPPVETVRLVGLDRGATQELLGPPALESEAASAKVWQYKAGPCQLEIFFSYDLARADFYVLSYTVNRGAGSPDSERQCLTRLAHDRTR